MESGTKINKFVRTEDMKFELIYDKNIDKHIEIIYEDNHLLVCTKPDGLLSQADHTGDDDMLSLLKEYLRKKYNKKGEAFLGLVHRLDRRVAGVMVFCKTSKAASRISEDIRNHKFHKVYLAVCAGEFSGSGELVNYLEKENGRAVERTCGKESRLLYKVINHFSLPDEGKKMAKFSVLKIELLTGKYNQIRKQMSLFSHPLINDFKYNYQGKKYGDTLGLRCIEIGFYHPITKEYMEFNVTSSISYQSNSLWTKYMEERYE